MKRPSEEAIAQTVARFHQDQQGHAPARVQAHAWGELVIVRSHDVFTVTERDLAATDEGKKIVQSARRDQRALTRRDIERQIGGLFGASVLRSFYDLDTRNGEQVEIFVLDRPVA